MRVTKVVVHVETSSGRNEKVMITFSASPGALEWFQGGASKEVMCFTQPIAEKLVELGFDGEIKLAG